MQLCKVRVADGSRVGIVEQGQVRLLSPGAGSLSLVLLCRVRIAWRTASRIILPPSDYPLLRSQAMPALVATVRATSLTHRR